MSHPPFLAWLTLTIVLPPVSVDIDFSLSFARFAKIVEQILSSAVLLKRCGMRHFVAGACHLQAF
jgi:hypothetical protein